MRVTGLLLLSVLGWTLGALAPSAALSSSDSDNASARQLYESALHRLNLGTVEQRRPAMEELEQAHLLDPSSPTYALALGRLCLAADMLHQARHWAQIVLGRDSSNSDAYFLLGSLWLRDWLVNADDSSLDRAIVSFGHSALLNPRDCDHWISLVPLLVEVGELRSARDAAEMAMAVDSTRADAMVAAAYTAQRTGDLERADPLFVRAMARLPEKVRERFEDITPLLTPRASLAFEDMNPGQRHAFELKFWKDADPDLVTPVNEARLEYWGRAAHAYFLYFDPQVGTWDMRGDLYVRYGPPRWADHDPLVLTTDPPGGSWMVWAYPDLGMRIRMEATNSLGRYRRPFTRLSTLPVPFPDSLAHHTNLMAIGGGWAVFARLPPSVEPLEIRCALEQFNSDAARLLYAQAESPGDPTADLAAEWAVFDSAGVEVARASRPMSASACDPIEARATNFTADLPAGSYGVGVDVHDDGGRRGVFRGQIVLRGKVDRLALSDVVVTCGRPAVGLSAGQRVPLEPNPRPRLSGTEQLNAYFEIYNLTADRSGSSRFEYVYSVRSTGKDSRNWILRALAPRPAPSPIEANRQEENLGRIRRQFLTVPIESLPRGHYELEVRVRDLVSGAETVGTAPFERGD